MFRLSQGVKKIPVNNTAVRSEEGNRKQDIEGKGTLH